ncbi:MAG: hypothetical protein WB816_04200, partial [Methylocystis sp.]
TPPAAATAAGAGRGGGGGAAGAAATNDVGVVFVLAHPARLAASEAEAPAIMARRVKKSMAVPYG